MKSMLPLLVVASCIVGCGSSNSYLAAKRQTIEYYRIFDIKTTASRQAVAKAARSGMARNVNNVQEAMPIPNGAGMPERAGRFKLVSPFAGTTFAALAGGAGMLAPRVATCDDAVWTARAERRIASSNDLHLTACLFQYRDGYHLDLYAVFNKQEGGLLQLSRDMASAMAGTPEEWTEKALLDIVRSVRAGTGAEIVLLEAQPEIGGMPWLDKLDNPLR